MIAALKRGGSSYEGGFDGLWNAKVEGESVWWLGVMFAPVLRNLKNKMACVGRWTSTLMIRG